LLLSLTESPVSFSATPSACISVLCCSVSRTLLFLFLQLLLRVFPYFAAQSHWLSCLFLCNSFCLSFRTLPPNLTDSPVSFCATPPPCPSSFCLSVLTL
jgi:hypothetical protein